MFEERKGGENILKRGEEGRGEKGARKRRNICIVGEVSHSLRH